MIVRSGSVQLGEVAGFGVHPEIGAHKEGLDAIRLRFTEVEQVKSPALRKFLTSKWVRKED
jgi:hypothetical protein